jgi:hypothetical protein
MKISDLLKQQGIFSAEIKTRFKNKQIQLNGEVVTDIDVGDVDVLDAGDFVFDMIRKHGQTMFTFFQMVGLENAFDTNMKNNITQILSSFSFLKTSKRECFILSKRTMRKLNEQFFDGCRMSKLIDRNAEKAIVFLFENEYNERIHFCFPEYDTIISKVIGIVKDETKQKVIKNTLLDLCFDDKQTCKVLDNLIKQKKEKEVLDILKTINDKI